MKAPRLPALAEPHPADARLARLFLSEQHAQGYATSRFDKDLLRAVLAGEDGPESGIPRDASPLPGGLTPEHRRSLYAALRHGVDRLDLHECLEWRLSGRPCRKCGDAGKMPDCPCRDGFPRWDDDGIAWVCDAGPEEAAEALAVSHRCYFDASEPLSDRAGQFLRSLRAAYAERLDAWKKRAPVDLAELDTVEEAYEEEASWFVFDFCDQDSNASADAPSIIATGCPHMVALWDGLFPDASGAGNLLASFPPLPCVAPWIANAWDEAEKALGFSPGLTRKQYRFVLDACSAGLSWDLERYIRGCPRSKKLADFPGACDFLVFVCEEEELNHPDVKEALALIEDYEERRYAASRPKTVPPGLLDPPGLVGQIARWILANARIPQPLFAVGAALAACSVLMARKVKSGTGEDGARTGLYVLLLGPSSCGKDWPRKAACRIVEKAGGASLLYGKPSSLAAVEKALLASPATLLDLDEIGHLFTEAKSGGKSGGSAADISEAFLKLFSEYNETYRCKGYAARDRAAETVPQPCLSILGTTTPDKLFGHGGMTREEIDNGFYPRFLVFPALGYGEETGPEDTAPVPESIVESCEKWVNFNPPAPSGVGDIEAATKPHPFPVPVEKDARDALRRFSDECRRDRCNGEARGEAGAALWGKAPELAARVALIVSAGCFQPGDTAATIRLKHAEWGIRLVRYLVPRMCEAVQGRVAENAVEQSKNSLLDAVRRIGGTSPDGWAAKSAITRATRGLYPQQRDTYLSELVESGELECRNGETRGRIPALYRAVQKG